MIQHLILVKGKVHKEHLSWSEARDKFVDLTLTQGIKGVQWVKIENGKTELVAYNDIPCTKKSSGTASSSS